MKARIYHNPHCSKSRATLALLGERGIDTDIVEYLREPPTAGELKQLLGKLGVPARAIVRTGEPEFRDAGLAADAPEDALLELIARRPTLLQRPIVEYGAHARIGRPPENVLDLFE